MMSGLASTLDSAFCGAGAIGGRTIVTMFKTKMSEKSEISLSRVIMVVFAFVGALLASVSRDIWFVFMTDAAIASSGIVPIVFSVFWKRQTAAASFWSLVLGAVAGVIIARLKERVNLVLVSDGLTAADAHTMGVTRFDSVAAAVSDAVAALPEAEQAGSVAVIPQAGIILPLMNVG